MAPSQGKPVRNRGGVGLGKHKLEYSSVSSRMEHRKLFKPGRVEKIAGMTAETEAVSMTHSCWATNTSFQLMLTATTANAPGTFTETVDGNKS